MSSATGIPERLARDGQSRAVAKSSRSASAAEAARSYGVCLELVSKVEAALAHPGQTAALRRCHMPPQRLLTIGLLATSIGLGLAGDSVQGARQRPDFSGEWVLDLANSRLHEDYSVLERGWCTSITESRRSRFAGYSLSRNVRAKRPTP